MVEHPARPDQNPDGRDIWIMADSLPTAPTLSGASPSRIAVELENKLDHMVHGLDALMLLSVSDHLDPRTQTALNFLHDGLDRLWTEASELIGVLRGALDAEKDGADV